MHEPLKNCPFCGGKAVASINKDESLWSHDVVDWTRVHCTNDECNAQTEATCEGYEPSAIEVWNLRTPQPVAREPLTLDEARRMFDAGWKAAALFCDREDVVADGIIGFGACPQFEAAFSAAHGIKGGQHGTE